MSTFVKSKKDTCPIILLDFYGSTEHFINLNKYFTNINTVLEYEINTDLNFLTSKGISKVYPIIVSELSTIHMESLGGTCLSKGLEDIPEEWIVSKGDGRK